MRFSESFFVVALFAFMQLVAAATPPACLLGALGVQPNPMDFKAVCDTNQKNVASNLTHACSGDNLKNAYSVYSAKCLEAASVTVAALPSSTSGSTATTTGSSGTGSSGTSTTSSGSSPSPTKNSAHGMAPQPLVFAISGLLATALTSVIFL